MFTLCAGDTHTFQSEASLQQSLGHPPLPGSQVPPGPVHRCNE